MNKEQLLADADTSPALTYMSHLYPEHFNGKVPLKIKMLKDAKADLPFNALMVYKDHEYYVWCNSHGAMAAILPSGARLGIKPHECEIIKWHNVDS